MKTIGLLGGMSWESTASYYRLINEGVKARLGGLHSARICLYSIDFDDIEQLQRAGQWQQAAQLLAEGARAVQSAGADFLLICTNTMHKVAPEVAAAIDIPLLHIVDTTGKKLLADSIDKVGLLGTRFTMEQAFYRDRLSERFGVEVLVPDAAQRDRVHQVIYSELCQGDIRASSRQQFVAVIDALRARGAQAVILGCTEIALLVQPQDTGVPLLDTTALHAAGAVELALAQ